MVVLAAKYDGFQKENENEQTQNLRRRQLEYRPGCENQAIALAGGNNFRRKIPDGPRG